MERMTNDEGEKLSSVKAAEAYKRLWEYENTGLLPIEIEDMMYRPDVPAKKVTGAAMRGECED